MAMKIGLISALVLFAGVLSSCKGGSQPDPLVVGKSPEQAQLISRGRAVYLSNCSACHNSDPRKVGVLAPEIHDASMELLEARVLRAEYPKGYQSKMAQRGQTPGVMPAMPFLENDLPAIFAFLQATAKLAPPAQ
jgi:mono/diheme cytochrome c family protein